jgi:hypothetical protein
MMLAKATEKALAYLKSTLCTAYALITLSYCNPGAK